MIFIGSLGIAVGIKFLPGQVLPFVAGILYFALGILNITSYACVGKGGQRGLQHPHGESAIVHQAGGGGGSSTSYTPPPQLRIEGAEQR